MYDRRVFFTGKTVGAPRAARGRGELNIINSCHSPVKIKNPTNGNTRYLLESEDLSEWTKNPPEDDPGAAARKQQGLILTAKGFTMPLA